MSRISIRAAALIILLALGGSVISFMYGGHFAGPTIVGNLLRLAIVVFALRIYLGQHPR